MKQSQQSQLTGTTSGDDSEIIGFVPVRGLQQQQMQPSSNLSGLPIIVIALCGMVGLSCFGSYFFARSQNTQSQITQAEERAVTAERKRFSSCINGGGNE